VVGARRVVEASGVTGSGVTAVKTAELAPAISVVVPTYMRADLLARLLARLEAVSAPDGGFEVIVVDDGSTDGTADVVARSNLPVRYVRQENSGPATARNRGWQLATAPIVAFTDDDCVPDDKWLVDLAAAFDASPDVAAIGGDIQPLVDGFRARFVQAERLVGHGADERGVRYLVTANAAVRTDALRAVGGFDEQFPGAAGEDTDLGFRLRAAGHRLAVTGSARTLHDHRIGWRALFRTYRKHGRARALLAQLHPDAGIGASTRSMATPRYWVNRYRYYRRSVGRTEAIAFVGLRMVGLACYARGAFGRGSGR
jgi:GT2 family glycosyltransferase